MVYRWNSKHDSAKDLLDNQYARRSVISTFTQYIGANDPEFRNRYLPHNFDYFSEHPFGIVAKSIGIAEGTKNLSQRTVRQPQVIPREALGFRSVQSGSEFALSRRSKSFIYLLSIFVRRKDGNLNATN